MCLCVCSQNLLHLVSPTQKGKTSNCGNNCDVFACHRVHRSTPSTPDTPDEQIRSIKLSADISKPPASTSDCLLPFSSAINLSIKCQSSSQRMGSLASQPIPLTANIVACLGRKGYLISLQNQNTFYSEIPSERETDRQNTPADLLIQ